MNAGIHGIRITEHGWMVECGTDLEVWNGTDLGGVEFGVKWDRFIHWLVSRFRPIFPPLFSRPNTEVPYTRSKNPPFFPISPPQNPPKFPQIPPQNPPKSPQNPPIFPQNTDLRWPFQGFLIDFPYFGTKLSPNGDIIWDSMWFPTTFPLISPFRAPMPWIPAFIICSRN